MKRKKGRIRERAVNLELGGLEHALVADSAHSSEGSTFLSSAGSHIEGATVGLFDFF